MVEFWAFLVSAVSIFCIECAGVCHPFFGRELAEIVNEEIPQRGFCFKASDEHEEFMFRDELEIV